MCFQMVMFLSLLVLQTQAVDNRSYHIQHVTNAQSMYEAVSAVFNTADIIIFAAAVADYTPQVKSKTKIKRARVH